MTLLLPLFAICALFTFVLYKIRGSYKEQIQELKTSVTVWESRYELVRIQLTSCQNELLGKKQELRTLNAKLDAVSNVNTELVKAASKDEDIKVIVKGNNANVKVSDVDGKSSTTTRKRGRKPGWKKPLTKRNKPNNP